MKDNEMDKMIRGSVPPPPEPQAPRTIKQGETPVRLDKDLERKQSEGLKYQGLAGIAKQNSERTSIEDAVAKESPFTKEINDIVEILRGKNLEDISFIMRRVLEYAKTNAKL